MNKKSKMILIICIIIVVLGVGGYLTYNSMHKEPTPPIIDIPSGDIKTPDAKADSIVVQDVKVENYTDNRYINCVYPKITNLTDKEFENYINKQIATNINEYRSEIEYIVDDETLPTEMYRYVTTYSRYNCDKYLSLVIDQDYQTGGIRSNKWKDIYNINVETQRIFYLEELFEAGAKYEEAIIAEITKQAEAKNMELVGGNGLTKLPKKQKFYIKDNKLIVYFDPSEISATAFGEQHFEMPFTMNEKGFFEIGQ